MDFFYVPDYSDLEINLTHKSRIYSEDRPFRVIWNNHFLRGFETEDECKHSLRFFRGFLNNIHYQYGDDIEIKIEG